MPGQYIASRFGQDMPARIAASTNMLLEATAFLPGELQIPALIPFYPTEVATGLPAGPAGSISTGPQTWERQPSRLDITFRQGDDVLIPLYMQDPENPTLDMSTWEWQAQIRRLPAYQSTLINEFTTSAEFFAPGTYHATLGTTLVKLLLPRETNDHWGYYAWELYSIGPADYSGFPQPADWPEDETWPPTTTLRTWLYGLCTIWPRTTDTDVLPELPPEPPEVTPIGVPLNYFAGPNGKVP